MPETESHRRMDLEWTCRREAGVAFVVCRLVNDASVPRRARLVNRLDGPVLPPRRRGVPEAGWDADGVTLTVAADETRAVGYACPAPEADGGPPAELVDIERVPEAELDDGESGATPNAAIRKLGDHRPPSAACEARSSPRVSTDLGPVADGRSSAVADRSDREAEPASSRSQEAEPSVTPAEPAAVQAWLDAVERRVARAERLDGADVETATEVLAATGGAAAAVELVDRVEADAETLAAVAERAETLAERAATAKPSTDALDRLA